VRDRTELIRITAPRPRPPCYNAAMLVVPAWLTFLVAGMVIAFGIFRVYLSITGRKPAAADRPRFQRKGLYAMSPRRHMLLGIIYLILGAMLIAGALGLTVSPFNTGG
jgi:hypothetical protein